MRMKKLLTFLTLLTLSFGVGWAATESVTLKYPSGNGTTNMTGNNDATTVGLSDTDWSVIGAKGGNTNFPGLNNNGYIAIYYNATASNTITVTSLTGATIEDIEITFTAKSYNNCSVKVNGTTLSATSSSDTKKEYTINNSSFVVSNANTSNVQVRISQIVIYYSTGSTTQTVATPTFSPDAGTYTEAQNVTISCATSGATIHYTTDGSTPTTNSATYSSAITVSSTTTIKAMAVKSGMNNSAVAEATYTIETPSTDQYQLVTDASTLAVGDKIIIASTGTNGSGQALSTNQATNNRTGTGVEISNSIIVPSNSVQIITLEKEGNNWLFNVGSGYLYAASSSNNWLRTETTPDANGNAEATISISSSGAATVVFQGTYTRNTINYNANNGNPIFSCYASGTVYIYKKVEATPQSNNVYIVGQINGHDSDPWVSTEGVQMTYNSTNDNYAANIYCTGMKNNEDNGYSYFIFTKSLPFDWDVNTNFYGSGGNGSYWGIGGQGESAFDEEIPLYDGSTDVYRLPAGLYTVTVDLDITGVHQYTTKSVKVTKRDVTLNVTNSATFETTKNVTMTSNLTELGGKIYYTTNGNDPRDQYSGRQEYTEQLTLDATTTIKAVAVLGCIYSDVVEKTYTKNPSAPEISPASCTFNEPLTVTITAESGATIYYTTDGSDPTNESTQYNGPFTVSSTTTVKARAYVGEAKSSIASATYTYSNVQPSTGAFTLVTDASTQLVPGYEYIIVYKDGEVTMDNEPKTNNFDPVEISLSENGTKATADEHTEIFTLEGSEGAWMFKVPETDGYLANDNGSNNRLYRNGNASSANSKATISVTSGLATIEFKSGNRNKLLYNGVNNPHVFSCYESVGNYNLVSLYYRPTNAVQNPVFSPVPGIYNVDIDVTISCATDGATIYYTTDGSTPSADNGTEYTGEIIVSESTTFKAIAVKGGNTSSVVTAEYTIQKSTDIETVTLTYSEPFTAGIGDFTIDNVSGFSPVWSLDGNYGVKGTSYSNGTNYAAVSRLVSPIIDMTGSVQPELSFSHQINSYFTNPTTQCQVFIRETTNGTSGTWVQIPITFSDPEAAGGWTNDFADIDLTDINGVSYADKKVQISFLYTNPTAGTGAGTWEIQSFVVADNSEYRTVNNIAEFMKLENGTKAKFKNPVTVLYDYAQYSSSSYHEYIWVKDESGYMQFFIQPTLNYDENNATAGKAAYYENGDIIPAGFVVTKDYYENGKYLEAKSNDALNAGFEEATQKGLADPEFMDFDTLHTLDATNDEDVANWCNHYITLEKIKIASKSGKNFTFANENGTVNACVGYNKYNGDGSLIKGGTKSADVSVPDVSNTSYYNAKGIIQLWQGGWEFMPVEFTEWKAKEVTLRKLCADGVVNNEYTISNNLLGVYAKGNTLWVKDDDDQSIWSSEPSAPNKENFAINFPENTRSEQAHYAQSNWCEIELTSSAAPFVGEIIKGGSISGTFTKKLNPTMTGVTLTEDDVYASGSYAPNYYVAANFQGSQNGYFFMNPKPQEYAHVVWAIYDATNEVMKMTTNTAQNPNGFTGSFKINLDLNSDPDITLVDGVTTGKGYENFEVIVRLKSTGQSGAPRLMPANSEYEVFPLNISNPTPTGIDNIVNGKAVKSVKYVNVAGIMSDTPFQGVNIVVTEYTDGSRSTTKMLRK